LSRAVDNLRYIRQTPYSGPFVQPLEEAKTPVRGELGVPYNKKRQSYLGMPPGHYTPCKHCIVLVLPCAIICVQKHLLLAQSMIVKEEMELTGNDISPLATVTSFIIQKVDLTRQGFTAHTKHGALPWNQEIDGTRL
jgi:hypothetical protein